MNSLAYRLIVLSALAAGACSAGLRPVAANGGTGGGGATAGTTGASGTSGTGNASGTGTAGTGNFGGAGAVSPPPPNPDAAACQTMDVTFEPKIPTVYLLVDRSGSMFHCLTGSTGDALCSDLNNTEWTKLKMAMESVLTQLDSQVRFGFTTIWGSNPAGSGGTCPSLQGMLTDDVPPALNNAGKIMAEYDSLAPPPNSTQVGVKFESPASESLGNVAKKLETDTTPGDKYIIFITDGQPDYCDDSNALCAPDSVIWQLQTAKMMGVTTIVFGLQTSLFDLPPGTLQAFANAGAGEPTVAPLRTGGKVSDFWDQCNGLAPWAADLTASGKPKMQGTSLGTYSDTAGPTKPYTPDASNQTQLVTQLSAALAGVKACTFDLSSFKINLNKLSMASVLINGTPVALDTGSMNGWNMVSETELQLFGTACDTWRAPASTDIKFNFPCDIVIN